MQAGGLAETTQTRYLANVDFFFKAVWTAPEDVTETMVKEFIIGVRNRDVARETFRGYQYALRFFFLTTMRREWESLKKTGFVPPRGSVFARR
jgi:hypothetical protein